MLFRASTNVDPCYVVLEFLLPIIILFIHMCRAHSYRSIDGWIDNKDRPEVARRSGVQDMFKNLAVRMTATKKLSNAFTMLSAAVVMFERPFVTVSAFTSSSETCEHKDDNLCNAIATHMYNLKNLAARSLRPTFDYKSMKSHLEEVMEANGDDKKERFNGLETAKPILDLLSRELQFAHAYLQSKSSDGRTGVLKVHIIQDAEHNGDGVVKPIFGGTFEVTVNLPFNGNLNNPLYQHHPDSTPENGYKRPILAAYLVNTWLSETVIWSRAVPHLLQTALGKIGQCFT